MTTQFSVEKIGPSLPFLRNLKIIGVPFGSAEHTLELLRSLPRSPTGLFIPHGGSPLLAEGAFAEQLLAGPSLSEPVENLKVLVAAVYPGRSSPSYASNLFREAQRHAVQVLLQHEEGMVPADTGPWIFWRACADIERNGGILDDGES
jgi:hypothetical protein